MSRLFDKLRELIVAYYQDRLSSIVLFGSVGRGEYSSRSDVDLLIVCDDLEDSLGKRLDGFGRVIERLKKEPEYLDTKEAGLPYRVCPIILEPEEFKSHPPILLDLVTDAKILLDKDDFAKKELALLKRSLQELGAKRIGRGKDWYWILKPGIKPGEVIEI